MGIEPDRTEMFYAMLEARSDEALRLLALQIGAQMWLGIASFDVEPGQSDPKHVPLSVAKWAYHEATGRKW